MLKIGIVGLPNVGKSTLFNALTRKKVDISNYPFCTIEPNVGVVTVPDERLEKLAALSHSKKIIPAVVEFVDIAGLVKGAAEGEGLGNKFLSHIKEVDVIAEVVRVFDDPDITHVAGKPNPVSDIDTIEYELILKDEEVVAKRIEANERDVRARKKGAAEEQTFLETMRAHLRKGKLASQLPDMPDELPPVVHELLTLKSFIYVFNVSEEQLQSGWKPQDGPLLERMGKSPWVSICAKVESELSDMTMEKKAEFLQSFGITESGSNKFIRTAYTTLGLLTYFTTGEDETRAWTIPIGSSAPRAGRAIHSDFEEKFIRAEIVNWQKLLDAGSWGKSREHGQLRTEGKEYIIRDGDVVEFKI